MPVWVAASWGLIGSVVAEALNLYGSMRPTTSHNHWRWPWRSTRERPIVATAIALRAVVGTGLSAAAGAGGVATTAFATFVFGVCAPLMIAKMFDQVTIVQAGASDKPSGRNG